MWETLVYIYSLYSYSIYMHSWTGETRDALPLSLVSEIPECETGFMYYISSFRWNGALMYCTWGCKLKKDCFERIALKCLYPLFSNFIYRNLSWRLLAHRHKEICTTGLSYLYQQNTRIIYMPITRYIDIFSKQRTLEDTIYWMSPFIYIYTWCNR